MRRREREAADVGETVARYMVERDRETAAREAEALNVARSTRKWAILACCVSAATALLAIFA